MIADAVEGINENGLDDLCMQILDFSDELADLFHRIDLALEPLPSYYTSDACNELLKNYQQFRKNYAMIKANILSYSEELIALKRRLAEDASYFTKMFTRYTEDIRSDLKTLL